MKILFILDLYTPHIGGVEILFQNIIDRLEKNGNTCVILTSRYDKSLKRYEKIGENIEIYRVGNNRYDFMFYSLFVGYKLAKKSDIIHTTTYNSAIPASIIGLLSRKKVILTVHEIFGKLWYSFMGWKGFFFKAFESFIFLFTFAKYICVSHYTKNSLRVHFGIDDKKLVTIYNAIDYDFWNRGNFSENTIESTRKKMGSDEKYIGLFYGRSGISKGLEFYIRAIPEIIKNIPNFQAFLILPQSKNNPTTYIETLIQELLIGEHVKIIGGVKNTDLPHYILASDCVILPSLAEGFGFAIAEVSALGQKLITTNIAAIPEVASGNTLLIEPSNASYIAQAIVRMHSGDYIIIPEKKFYWDENISDLEELYKEILGK